MRRALPLLLTLLCLSLLTLPSAQAQFLDDDGLFLHDTATLKAGHGVLLNHTSRREIVGLELTDGDRSSWYEDDPRWQSITALGVGITDRWDLWVQASYTHQRVTTVRTDPNGRELGEETTSSDGLGYMLVQSRYALLAQPDGIRPRLTARLAARLGGTSRKPFVGTQQSNDYGFGFSLGWKLPAAITADLHTFYWINGRVERDLLYSGYSFSTNYTDIANELRLGVVLQRELPIEPLRLRVGLDYRDRAADRHSMFAAGTDRHIMRADVLIQIDMVLRDLPVIDSLHVRPGARINLQSTTGIYEYHRYTLDVILRFNARGR